VALAILTGCGGPETADEQGVGELSEAELIAIVEDLNAFWAVADDDLGFTYRPVPAERVSFGDDGVTCDGSPSNPRRWTTTPSSTRGAPRGCW
jgi:hypothetical protein